MMRISPWRVTRFALVVLPVLFVLFMTGFYSHGTDPCVEPVTYRIGKVDERFGLSRREVAEEVRKAASVWERAAGCRLFREAPDGAVEINLVYDHRQTVSDRLKVMSDGMDGTRGSYEALKAHFDQLDAEYRQQNAVLAGDVEAYNARARALKAAIDAANREGGVPGDTRRRFMEEKDALEAMREDIRLRQVESRNTAETLKSMVSVINEMASNLNLGAVRYNNAGKALGDEFSEGCYERKEGRQSITVFHFNDRKRLVRVLAHELGHALGLKHNDDPASLMYRLNISDGTDLSPDDVAALQSRLSKR